MEQDLIRLLKADEIECRVSVISAKGLSLLLYKDARVDQRILDETFGAFRWKRSHQCIDGNLYCTVEILDKDSGEWIAKQDVGTVGTYEKEKSQASDSFKRACFNWGIGRELYSAPFIWISAGKVNIQSKGEKFYCNESFSVSAIAYNDDREISSLTIVNGKGQTVYEMGEQKRQEQQKKQEQQPSPQSISSKSRKTNLSKKQMDSLTAELKRTGVEMQAVRDRYRVEKTEEMPPEIYDKVMSALRRTKSVQTA